MPSPNALSSPPFPRGNENPVVIADWSKADFPQQGVSPVIFPFAWKPYREVRIQVIKGSEMEGGHAFALSEVSFPRRYSTWPIDLNISTEDSLEAPPYWSMAYATDGRTAFESPAPAADSHRGTFQPGSQPSLPAQITILHEKNTQWNSFEFYPTQHPLGLPPEGFPSGFRIEFSNKDDFSDIIRTEQTQEDVKLPDGKFPYVLNFPSVDARCVRITLLPEEQQLQLEEITFNGGLPLVMRGWYFERRTISGTSGTSALYDRIANGNYVDPPVRQSANLTRRNELVDELKRVEMIIQSIRESDARTKARIKTGSVIMAAALAVFFVIYQRRQSKKAQLRIRHRIQQDLHDEIGSQLSAISMITNLNQKIPDLPLKLRTGLTDVMQCAREATASLREVIWLTEKEILTLDQCFEVMKNRAEKMVHTMKLELSFPDKVPPLQLSYQTKRNLILLFTEALNNALKHSEADTIRIAASLDDNRDFRLSISDNGTGFSLEAVNDGIGLNSMTARSNALGGKLEIASSPGQGTTICFTGKL